MMFNSNFYFLTNYKQLSVESNLFKSGQTNYKNKKSCIISHKILIPEMMDDDNEVCL